MVSKYFSRKNIYNFVLADLRLIEKTFPKTLCIGSGGNLEKLIKNNTKINYITIDIDKNRDPDIVMDACDLKFEECEFDLIIMLEVLEHTKNPFKAISECYRVLKLGGTLILSTPFILGIHEAPYDHFRFTKYGLKVLLEKFSNIYISSRNGYFEAVIVLLMRFWFSATKINKIFGIFLILLATPFGFIAKFLDVLFKTDNLTTGYYTKAIK